MLTVWDRKHRRSTSLEQSSADFYVSVASNSEVSNELSDGPTVFQNVNIKYHVKSWCLWNLATPNENRRIVRCDLLKNA